MERSAERELEILRAIGEGAALTQRALAERLGVALGLTNLYLKRLAKKGYIKIAEFPKKPAARKRPRYVLTPTGLRETTRLTYEHVAYALNLYRRTRQTLREELHRFPESGLKRVALHGTDEAAELAYLTLKEAGLEPVAVFGTAPGGQFIGLPVRAVTELVPEDYDAVIVATFDRPGPQRPDLLRLGVGHGVDRFTAIAALCGVFVAVGLLKGVLDFWNYMLALWIRVRAGGAMQLDLFRHLLGLSLGFFNRQRTGELVSRLDEDTRATSAGLETVACTLLSAPLLVLFYG